MSGFVKLTDRNTKKEVYFRPEAIIAVGYSRPGCGKQVTQVTLVSSHVHDVEETVQAVMDKISAFD